MWRSQNYADSAHCFVTSLVIPVNILPLKSIEVSYLTGIKQELNPSQRFCQISQNPVKLLSDFTLPSQKTSNSADLWEHHQIIKTAKWQKNDRTSILRRVKAKRDCINQCHSLKLNWLRSFWHVLFLYLFFVLMLINVSLFFNIIPYLI